MEINKIYDGDCMELLKSLPDESIDLKDNNWLKLLGG